MEGQNLTGGDTDRGYNLRSQGPATLGVEALDRGPEAHRIKYRDWISDLLGLDWALLGS